MSKREKIVDFVVGTFFHDNCICSRLVLFGGVLNE